MECITSNKDFFKMLKVMGVCVGVMFGKFGSPFLAIAGLLIV